MTAAFQSAGLTGARLADSQILVPKAKMDAYLVALDADDALPADFDDELDAVAADSNPFASRQQTEMGYRLAEQKKLARILSGMNGIETASVQYAEIKKPGFPPTYDVRAVVAVRAEGKRPLTYEEIEAIRDTVAGYVAGLNRAQVTVSDLNACRAYPGEADTPGSAAASYAARAEQSRWEEEYRVKIQRRLAAYPAAIVGVNVQLAESSDSVSPEAASAVAGRRRFMPALVAASIDLPKSYFTQVWSERNPDARSSSPNQPALQAVELDVKRTVEQAVLALLPPPAAHLRGSPQVVVTAYDDLPPPHDATAFGLRSRGIAWIANYGALAAAALLLTVSLLLYVRTRRRAGGGLRVYQPEEAGEAPGNIALAPLAPGSANGPGAEPDLQAEISRAIQRNPQAAAETLQRWLGKAA